MLKCLTQLNLLLRDNSYYRYLYYLFWIILFFILFFINLLFYATLFSDKILFCLKLISRKYNLSTWLLYGGSNNQL